MPEVIKSPTEYNHDMPRWLTRFSLVELALSEFRIKFSEGWGEGGMGNWNLAASNIPLDKLENTTEFEESVLRGISSVMPNENDKRILPVIESLVDPIEELPSDTSSRSKEIGRFATQIGLVRIGVLKPEDDKFKLDDGAFAALCYLRADIDEPYDRLLHEMRFKKAAPQMRSYKYKKANGESAEISVYKLLTHYGPADIGLDEYKNEYEAWWGELGKDLLKVDQLFELSENSGTAKGNQNPAHEATA